MNCSGTPEDHGAVTSNTYDLAGNLLTTTSPSPTGSGTVTTVNTYDQQNNLLTSEDADGNVTSYTHDQLGETTSLTDTDGNSTYATYDHDGQQTSQSSVAALGYFADGTVNTQTATSYFFYDGFGNPSAAIDADYRSIGYTFNDVNEETQEQWFDQSGNQTGEVDYTYNAAGVTTEAKNYAGASDSTPVADYHYYYDLAGNVADVSANLAGVSGGSTPVQLGAAYDYNGDMTSLAANIGGTPNYDANYGFTGFSDGVNDFVNNYTYDQFGDPTSIVQTSQATGTYNVVAAKTVTFAYNTDEQVTGQNFYNTDDSGDLGASTLVAAAAYTYDHDAELTDIRYTDGAGNTVAGYHYVYSARASSATNTPAATLPARLDQAIPVGPRRATPMMPAGS